MRNIKEISKYPLKLMMSFVIIALVSTDVFSTQAKNADNFDVSKSNLNSFKESTQKTVNQQIIEGYHNINGLNNYTGKAPRLVNESNQNIEFKSKHFGIFNLPKNSKKQEYKDLAKTMSKLVGRGEMVFTVTVPIGAGNFIKQGSFGVRLNNSTIFKQDEYPAQNRSAVASYSHLSKTKRDDLTNPQVIVEELSFSKSQPFILDSDSGAATGLH